MTDSSEILRKIEAAGVVGAGGAGFPTHVKVKCKAEVAIANCAECEPLLKVDKNVMERFPDLVAGGLAAVMKATGAPKGYVALKAKNHAAHDAMEKAVKSYPGMEVFLLENYYPAGDEQQIVYEITGKVVPVGGIPIDVGAVVCNASTLYNISLALEDKPVTTKFVTVNGDVKTPATFEVPIGTPICALVSQAGGPSDLSGYSFILGGPMMGRVTEDANTPVTKTTSGVIVLPKTHSLIRKKTASLESEHRIARSVCCQCSQCTMMCPRNLLGLNVQPHKVMRAIAYGNIDSVGNGAITFGCCDCGLCTQFACPMGLSPSRFVTAVKSGLMKKGVRPAKTYSTGVSETRNVTKVPTGRLVERLGLSSYKSDAPLADSFMNVGRVRIPLRQHIGVPSQPVVSKGDTVSCGALVAKISEGKLGANIHASISGRIADVTADYIEIAAE